MADDSLLSALSDALDAELSRGHMQRDSSIPAGLPYASTMNVRRHSKEMLNSAMQSLAHDTNRSLGYSNLVRFLADTTVPLVESFTKEPVLLGSGWTMDVYRGSGEIRGSTRLVAVEEININIALGASSEEERTTEFRAKIASAILEIRLMSHDLLRSHANIVRLLGIGWTARRLRVGEAPTLVPALLVELALIVNEQPMTLELLIKSSRDGTLPIGLLTRLWADVASGLSALHALGVVHGDLKPQNVLIFEAESTLTVRISDFGFCLTGDRKLQSGRGGTPLWNAPERMEDAPESMRAHRYEVTRDYYSFGLLIWFVLFSSIPFWGQHDRLQELKLKPTLKDYIDTQGTAVYEEFNAQTGLWREFTTPALDIAREAFGNLGTWDRQWTEFGSPEKRFPPPQISSTAQVSRRTLYDVQVDELLDWGSFRFFEHPATGKKVEQLAEKSVPFELAKQFFRDSKELVTESIDPENLTRLNIVVV